MGGNGAFGEIRLQFLGVSVCGCVAALKTRLSIPLSGSNCRRQRRLHRLAHRPWSATGETAHSLICGLASWIPARLKIQSRRSFGSNP